MTLSTKTPKPKVCRCCKTLFTPQRMGAVCCSAYCALTFAKSERAKAEKVAAVKDRRETKGKLQAMKTIPQLLRAAQQAFNMFIRERDRKAGHACISSGRPLDWSGNGVDAGHFRSVGAAPHIRFNEDNCHAQSKHDNQYLSGNMGAYRLGLIARIGLERVEKLEASNFVNKWTRDELIEIKNTYTARARALIKERG